MPPRFAYWTIIFGNQPTAFRAGTREELLPTFKQIQAKHPDAVMMWFARGRLWKSEEEARDALLRRRQERAPRRGGEIRRPSFGDRDRERGPESKDRRPAGRPPNRGRDWRPGGEHKDPRDRFKVPRDVKRARFKAKVQRDRFKPGGPPPRRRGPNGDRKKKDEE